MWASATTALNRTNIVRIPYAKYSTGANRTTSRRAVRLGNPIRRPPEGRSLRDALSANGTQKQNAFSGATALFRVPSALFFHIFSRKREKIWPPEASRAFGASEMGLRRDFAPDGAKNRKGVSPFRFLSFQKAHGNNGRCRLRSRRRSGCGNRPWPAARPLRRWSYSRSPRS